LTLPLAGIQPPLTDEPFPRKSIPLRLGASEVIGMRNRGGCFGRRGVFGGIFLVFLGACLLLANLGFFQWPVLRTWWPLLLIFGGAASLAGHFLRPSRPERPYSDFA
jgi:hypothetical protein